MHFGRKLAEGAVQVRQKGCDIIALNDNIQRADIDDGAQFHKFLPAVLLQDDAVQHRVQHFLVVVFAHKGAVGTLDVQDAVGLQLFHSLPHRVAARAELFAQFHFGGQLVARMQGAVDDLGDDPVHDLIDYRLYRILLLFRMFHCHNSASKSGLVDIRGRST